MTGWTGMQQPCNTGNVSNTSASESCHTFKLCCTITHSSYTFIELHTGSEVLAKSLLGLVQNVTSLPCAKPDEQALHGFWVAV